MRTKSRVKDYMDTRRIFNVEAKPAVKIRHIVHRTSFYCALALRHNSIIMCCLKSLWDDDASIVWSSYSRWRRRSNDHHHFELYNELFPSQQHAHTTSTSWHIWLRYAEWCVKCSPIYARKKELYYTYNRNGELNRFRGPNPLSLRTNNNEDAITFMAICFMFISTLFKPNVYRNHYFKKPFDLKTFKTFSMFY